MSQAKLSRFPRQFPNGHASQNGKHGVSIGDVAKSIDLRKLIESDLGEPQGGTTRDPKWCCPFHEENTPSFHIQPDGKHFKCFGCNASGDAIDYMAKRYGIEPIEAARRLSGEPEPGPSVPRRARATRPRPEPARFSKVIHKDLNGAIAATAQRLKGKEASRYAYHHADGKPAFWQVRFDLAGGKKTFRPFHQDETGYFCEGNPITSGRPLYRLPLIDKHRREAAGQWVLLCEGEKCADQAVLLGFQATTSSHGSQSADGTDFSPLAGLKIVLIPDNDQAGEKYIADVQEQLVKLDPRPTVKILHLPRLSEGEDLIEWSDRGGTGEQLVQLIEQAPGWSKPKPFSLELVSSEEFFAETYTLQWLIKNVLVKSEPAVFGGPQKTLKTSMLLDATISLGTATEFLGRWAVPKAIRVAMISGESGRYVIQANAREIAKARAIENSSELKNIFWGFVLPQLTNAEHLKILTSTIRDQGIEAITLDPLYLSLLAGSSNIDPKDMYQMGPLLADVAAACLDAGATPILAHHFVKKREDPYGPPEMGELAYAGIGQFMRQWMLISRRERFDAETCVHKLHFHFGGSAGHCGEYALDIETGKIDENFKGRKWIVKVSTIAEDVAAAVERRNAEHAQKRSERTQLMATETEQAEREAMGQALAVARKLGGTFTVQGLCDAIGWGRRKAARIIFKLGEDGRIRVAKVSVKAANRKEAQVYDGYEVVE